jgi:hypothetical protein
MVYKICEARGCGEPATHYQKLASKEIHWFCCRHSEIIDKLVLDIALMLRDDYVEAQNQSDKFRSSCIDLLCSNTIDVSV